MIDTINIIFILSIILNILLVGLGLSFIAKKGGISYLLSKLAFSASGQLYENYYYHEKKSHFESLPPIDSAIVFVGDSLTDSCEWSELFPGQIIINRGISGDRTDGVLNRVDEIVRSKPQKILIMVGINDLVQGKKLVNVINNYKLILEKFQFQLPDTEVLIQSVLPINSPKAWEAKQIKLNNNKVIAMNTKLKALAQEFSFQYLDLFSSFLDTDNQLDLRYTLDGIHLNGEGYLHWRKSIEKNIVN
ncbi:MAG: G-D-S-L family lipolytic protein [Symploca sp. SIO3C6]|uniref:G-D-S-L family lipolytic protein n=1 Tax=Symploca sp. SIO1C4 TaxID=2607765 RepID=A0A6B3NKY6_9CYAN|nr:G-D-S-L family lipolytic protein [Symploca sp. SIO3C6]NER31575.1 G-D-S-L family lipolytic protein [Symploca sp. SIO1C4]